MKISYRPATDYGKPKALSTLLNKDNEVFTLIVKLVLASGSLLMRAIRPIVIDVFIPQIFVVVPLIGIYVNRIVSVMSVIVAIFLISLMSNAILSPALSPTLYPAAFV